MVFHLIMQLQTSMQSILINIFRIDLLQLSAGTYEATSVRFGYFLKALLPRLRGKRIAIILTIS